MCDHDLRKILREQHFVPLATAIPILSQVAQAIDYTHASGVIHGDVKPENILFSAARSHVHLADFGTAHFFAFSEAITTAPNFRGGGTTAYLSPEQLEAGQLTMRSDIYSFSVVAYELLTGDLPFDPTEPAYRQMTAKFSGHPRDPRTLNPSVPESVATALLQGLEVDPQKRPTTATELCLQLSSPPSPAPAPVAIVLPLVPKQREKIAGSPEDTLTERAIRWMQNQPVLAPLIVIGIIVVAVGAVAEGVIHVRDLIEPDAASSIPHAHAVSGAFVQASANNVDPSRITCLEDREKGQIIPANTRVCVTMHGSWLGPWGHAVAPFGERDAPHIRGTTVWIQATDGQVLTTEARYAHPNEFQERVSYYVCTRPPGGAEINPDDRVAIDIRTSTVPCRTPVVP